MVIEKTENTIAIESLLTGLYMHMELLLLGFELKKDPQALLEDFTKYFNDVKNSGLGAFWQSNNKMYAMVYFHLNKVIREIENNPTFSASPLDTALSELLTEYRELEKVEKDIFDNTIEKYPHGQHDAMLRDLLTDGQKHLMKLTDEVEHTKKRLRGLEDDIYWKQVSLKLISKPN